MPGRVFAGAVQRVAPYITALEKQARMVAVDVAFVRPEEARGMLVGYSADVEIVLEVREDALRIPTATLREGNRVLVYRPADATLEERALRTGLADWEYTEVRDGLAAGEQVVSSLEREGIRAGARVRPDEAAR